MGLAGVVSAGNNLNKCSGPDREKDLPHWLLRWAWPIHVIVLLALVAAGAIPRSCRLARGLLLSGTLHGCLDLGLLAALSWYLIGCLANFQAAEDFGLFSVSQLAEASVMDCGLRDGLGSHGNGYRSDIDRVSLFTRSFPISESCADSSRFYRRRLWCLICHRVVIGRFSVCNTGQCAEAGII